MPEPQSLRRCLVIGASGFLGANVVAHLESHGIEVDSAFRDTSREALAATQYDCVFFCAGNSKTYVTNREPLTCLEESVAALYRDLTALSYSKWLLLSSSTVYPQDDPEKLESTPIRIHETSIYGAHKLLAERYVSQFAQNWVVLRPTGFFGPGLKKNLLFDVRAGRPDVYVKRASRIDYLPVERFCGIARTLAEKANRQIVNVGAGHTLPVDDILAMKPNDYVFHEERLQDDRSLSLAKLRHFCPDRLSADELRRQVRGFLRA